jgi:hypothetical protein
MALDAGTLTPSEHEQIEDELLERLDAIRTAKREVAP